MCLKPFRQGIVEFGCGQCMPCRINRRRLWTARLMLEQTQHQASFFVTLTYKDEKVPEHGSLDKFAIYDYMKRLRAAVHPRKVRYYGVGEYGDRSMRPHYHVLLFGLLDRKEIARAWGVLGDEVLNTPLEYKVHTTTGIVHVGDVTIDSIGYVVSYVCKRMTRRDDPRLGDKRYPEYARMSLKPGIGAGAIHAFEHSLNSRVGAKYIAETGGLPPAWRMNGKLWPFGRYLGGKLREGLGFVKPELYDRDAALDVRLLARREELSQPGAVGKREGKRVAGGRRAEFHDRLSKQRRPL